MNAVLLLLVDRRTPSPDPTGGRPSLHIMTYLMTRDDRRLDIPVAVQHVAQHIVQTR